MAVGMLATILYLKMAGNEFFTQNEGHAHSN